MARVTVEDCLEQLPNRFALIHLATRRARQLKKEAEPLVASENKECVTALREIAESKIRFDYDVVDAIEGRIRRDKKRARRRGR